MWILFSMRNFDLGHGEDIGRGRWAPDGNLWKTWEDVDLRKVFVVG